MAYKLKRMFDYQPLTAEQATRGEHWHIPEC